MIRKCLNVAFGILRLIKEKVWNLNHLKTCGIKYYIGFGVKFTYSGNGFVDIGKRTWIDRYCHFSAANGSSVIMGYNNYFNSNIKIAAKCRITIGDNNLFGPNVVIVDHNHKFNDPNKLICQQGFNSSPINIGSNTWIGANVTICSGVSVCDRVVIGANSVVTKSISEPGVYSGVPAIKIKDL